MERKGGCNVSKDEYLARLGALLAGHLPEQQVDGILRYYERYFQEVGPEGEADLIAELGPPEALAARILDRPVNGGFSPSDQAAQGQWREQAAPSYRSVLSFPVAAGIILLAVVLFLLAFGLAFGLGLGGLICIGTGIGLTFGGFFTMGAFAIFTSFGPRLLLGGGGLFTIGFGLLMFAGAAGAFRCCWRGAFALIRRLGGGDRK